MLDLSDEQRMLVDSVRDLAENEFAADAFTWQGDIPWENVRTLADHGFLGVNFDEAYGGAGMTEFEVILLLEAVGSVCPDTTAFIMGQHLIAPRAIETFGSEAAKERYLPPVIAGEDNITVAMSEPEAGSDLRAMNTTATEEGDTLVVDGEKTWVSFVPESSAAVVWAKFDDGLGSVVVELDAPGIEVAEHYTNMSGHTQTHFFLDSVEVPAENELMRGEDAFKQRMRALNWERAGGAVLKTTFARVALERALEYAQEREQFDQPIGEFQGIEWKLADMITNLEAARALVYRATRQAVERGRTPDPLQMSIASLFAQEAASTIVDESLQIHGANGYQRGHPLEYLYRHVRGGKIAGGTQEVIRNTIASLLKKEGVPTIT